MGTPIPAPGACVPRLPHSPAWAVCRRPQASVNGDRDGAGAGRGAGAWDPQPGAAPPGLIRPPAAVCGVGLRLAGQTRLHRGVLHHLRGDAEGDGGEQGGRADVGTACGVTPPCCQQIPFQEAPPSSSSGFGAVPPSLPPSLGKGWWVWAPLGKSDAVGLEGAHGLAESGGRRLHAGAVGQWGYGAAGLWGRGAGAPWGCRVAGLWGWGVMGL